MAPSGCDYMPRVVSGLYIGPAFPTMSNVTGSQMLSHSMSVAGRPAEFLSVPHFLMESVGEPRSPNGDGSKLLCLPTLSPWDDTEDPLEGLEERVKLKSSPIPRRRSSVSSDDSELPPSNSRRVSFADAFGLSLVTVKQFDARAVTGPPCPLESDSNEAEYYIIPLFTLPQTAEDLVLKVHQQKLELESLELLPGTTTLRGIVRVLNVCFDKTIYVRTSLDLWKSHFDLLAEYVPGSDCCETDRFSFKLTLVPPFGEEGTRVDFCLRYETSLGTFWSNNNEQNYSLFCCEKAKDKPQTPSESRIKSCLKVSTKFSSTDATSNEESLENDLIMCSVAESDSKEKEEERQKEKELEEEMRRNHSQRHKRKAARMAKVKEFFAQREEEKTKRSGTDEPLLTDETSKQDHPSPEETPSGPQSQQISVRPPTCSQALTSSAEHLTVDEKVEDPADILSQAVECHGEETMRSSERNVLCNKSGSYSEIKVFENTDTVKEQTNSVNLSEHACRNSNISDGKNVEKAWEHFEQDAKQKMKSLTQIDEDVNVSHVNNTLNNAILKKNPEPQLFTFGTIVAPFYQQVFKNMERERKDFILSAFHGDQSKKQESGMIRPSENDSTPIRPNTDVTSKAQKINLTELTEKNSTQTSKILISDLKHSRENSSNINVIENSTIEFLSLKMSLLHYATPPRAEQPIKRDSCISSFLPLDESPSLVNNEVLSVQPPLIFNSLCLENPTKSMCLLNQDRSLRVEQLNRTVYPQDTKMLEASNIELVSSEDNFQGIRLNFAQLSHTVSECYQESLNTRTNVAFCEEHPTNSPSNEEHENIIVIEPEVSQNERASMNKEELMERREEKEIIIEEEIKYIDDDEDSEICKWEPERKHKMINITDSKSLSVDFIQTEGRQCTNEGSEDVWWPQSTKTSELSDLTSIGDEWDLMEFIDKEDVCCDKRVKNKCEDAAENNMVDNTKGQGEDPTTGDLKEADEDNASTESLVDEEMDLYLYSLRNSNQSVLKEAGNYSKRPSISRGRTLSMPSILEEDQPNTFCEDLLNNTENGDALDEKDEQVVGQNVLWWKEFLSYENLTRVCGYTFLFIAFLISTYYYDFNAYLALYLLTVYWLFCQKDGKSLKSSRKDK